MPLGTYPEDTMGGMLQQASLWPWAAGIVAMVAIWQWRWSEGDGGDSVNDCVLMCLVMAVERLFDGMEEERG